MKVGLPFLYSSMKKNQKDSANFWHRKMTLKVRIVLFSTFNSITTERPKIFVLPFSYCIGLAYEPLNSAACRIISIWWNHLFHNMSFSIFKSKSKLCTGCKLLAPASAGIDKGLCRVAASDSDPLAEDSDSPDFSSGSPLSCRTVILFLWCLRWVDFFLSLKLS